MTVYEAIKQEKVIHLRPLTKLIFFIVLSLFLSNASFGFAASRQSVLVLPFNTQGENDLSFLQKGISQMLVTRLGSDGTIDVVDLDAAGQIARSLPKPVSEQAAISLALKLKADYVSFGNLTADGKSVRTDAKLLRAGDGKTMVIFNQTGKNEGEVLQHVKAFAAETLKALGLSATALTKPIPVKESGQQIAVDESRRHPDTLWTGAISTGAEPMRTMASDGKTSASVWRSIKFDSEITSLAIGNVLGNKQNELVIINDYTVSLYRYAEGKLQLIDEVTSEINHTPIRVDVADINQNGRAEIFVTNTYRDSQVKSYVLEWDGSKLAKIVRDAEWYFRVMTMPDKRSALLGQKQGLYDLFEKGIFQLEWQNNKYHESKPISAPQGSSLYAFTSGNALNDGKDVMLAITSGLNLRVFNKAGDVEWTSSERFTGGGTYIQYPSDQRERLVGNEKTVSRYYLPQRIFIEDLDKDGKNDVIFINNKDVMGNYFPNLRIFRSGHVQCLQWDNSGFALKWKTTEVTGQISDMVIGDLKNDGQDEIVFSLVDFPSTALNKGSSYIVSWTIGK